MRRLVLTPLTLLVLACGSIWLSCGRDTTVVSSDRSLPVEGDEGAALFEWAIGPIEGITTAWHPAPSEITVPVGATFRLKCGGSRLAEIQWSNAQEVSRGDRGSIAECHIDTPGRHEISVTMEPNVASGRDKRDRTQTTSSVHSCIVNGIDAGVDQVGVVALEPRVAPFLLTESSSNYETMKAVLGGDEYGQGVSQLRHVGPNHYRTAVNRNVGLGATLTDPRFASVIETRITGERPTLGSELVYLQKPGRYTVSVGPPGKAKSILLETYKVTITGITNSGGGSSVLDGEPATFVAKTDPPGYEDEITWVSSTKYGEAHPVVGHGAQFTVEFKNTSRNDSWLGVRADNAALNLDQATQPTLVLRQLSINLDNVVTNYSQWGHAELTFTGSASILYFNLSVNGQWPIQNMPVQSVDGVGVLQGVSFGFDLGVSVGTPVTSAGAGWALTGFPIAAMPAQTGTFGVTQQFFYEYYGIDGIIPLATYSAPPLLIGGAAQEGAKHNNENFPNQEAKKCACAPTAVSNSLKFLKARHNLNIPDAAITPVQMEAATRWGENVPDKCLASWPNSKNAYMQNHSLPITTATTADIECVIKAIDKGCDVEVNAAGHTAAIVGVTRHAGGKYTITIKHDVKQNEEGGTGKEGTEEGTFDAGTNKITGIQWYNDVRVFNFVIECPTGVDPGC